MQYGKHLQNTPQSEPLPGKTMVPNAAGGYVFQLDKWQRLTRFLILGCEGGTYYESERKLTLENAACIRACLDENGPQTVDEIVRVSDGGLAPKNDPAVFALACATYFGNEGTKKYAFAALPKVCRIGTHLFQFCDARQAVGGGWGRGMREAVSKWYTERSADDLVNQVLKYQQRDGWAQRDVLRLAHPVGEPWQNAVFNAVCRPDAWLTTLDTLSDTFAHGLATGHVAIQAATDAAEAALIISEHKLPRELVPTQFLNDSLVWRALLPHMPMTAMVRNLGNLSKAGVLAPFARETQLVCERLRDVNLIRKSRLHPIAILLAARTYSGGRGVRGRGEWTVVPQVVEALDEAFNLAFFNVQPTGKNFVLGVDVSSSMSYNSTGVLTAAEAAAAMALITARTEPYYFIGGFSTQFIELGITARDTLPDVLHKTVGKTFGGTDTSVAIQHALEHNIPAEVFVIYTDAETWAGDVHTCQALQDYRRRTDIPAKLAVVAFTATGRTIRDNADEGSMDFVGLDASLPQALAAFATL